MGAFTDELYPLSHTKEILSALVPVLRDRGGWPKSIFFFEGIGWFTVRSGVVPTRVGVDGPLLGRSFRKHL